MNDPYSFRSQHNTPLDPTNANFNQNISEIRWKTACDLVERSYLYDYGSLDRILSPVSNAGNYDVVKLIPYGFKSAPKNIGSVSLYTP